MGCCIFDINVYLCNVLTTGTGFTEQTTTMVKSFSFSLDSDYEVEEISNEENITYDESEEIVNRLVNSGEIYIGERTEGSVTFDDSVTPIVYNVDYRYCSELGEDWDTDKWEELDVHVQL